MAEQLLKNSKKEAKENGIPSKEIEKIMPDTDTEHQIGENGHIELEGGADDNKKSYIRH